MTFEEEARKAFQEQRWKDGIDAALKTDLSDAVVLAWLGYCRRWGKGLPVDYAKAFSWFEKSAQKGNAFSQNELGMCYEFGRGTDKNLSLAFQWYLKSAEGNNASGQFNVADMYELGKGTEKSLEVAFKWYKASAAKGNDKAQNRLGVLYGNGIGTEKDISKALEWYRKAAENGNSNAQNSLGHCYEYGKGVEKDIAEAFKWYLKAAEGGDMYGQFNVADMYEFGKGVEKNLGKALEWYRKAAENGYVRGMFKMGWCYESGNGVEKDFDEAKKWYEKAKDAGSDDAEDALKRLEERAKAESCAKAEQVQRAKEATELDEALRELDELVGLKPVKEDIRRLADFFKVQKMRKEAGLPVSQDSSYHCVFTGNPGTGKTTVARIMARIYHALGVTKTKHLEEADRSKLVAEYTGQTAPKTNRVIDAALDGVLFIDEAYSLVEDGDKFNYGKEVINTLLKRMEDDRDRLVVIVAGYTKEMKKFIDMNPGLKSRFTRYIEFPDYSEDELVEIFVRLAKKDQFNLGAGVLDGVRNEMRKLLADKSKSFGNARDVRTLYQGIRERQAVRLAKEQNPTKEQLTEIMSIDVSPDSAMSEGEYAYLFVQKAALLDEAKGLFRAEQIRYWSNVKRYSFLVEERLKAEGDAIRDREKSIVPMIRANAKAALYIGLGASVEYKLNPLGLDNESIYNMMMGRGGYDKVEDVAIAKLGEFATEEVKAKLEAFSLAFQSLSVDVAKSFSKMREDESVPEDCRDGLLMTVRSETMAAFWIGFGIGYGLLLEGAMEVEHNGLSVCMDYMRYLNLALAQNARPLISSLRIGNKGNAALRHCECRISCPEGFLQECNRALGDIERGKAVDVGAIPVGFNVEPFCHIESAQLARLRLELFSEGRLVFCHDYRIEAVAPGQSHDILRQPDMLAAYVMPHCDVVRKMQSDVATFLVQWTGKPGVGGYQGDREYVATICRAIFESMKRRFIRYAENPASFGLPGQRIRLPEEIMKFKLATCLDTTLLYAAIAEACGLHPVVVLIQGHSLIGVFLEDLSLSGVAFDTSTAIKKTCSDNSLIMIETTAVCHGHPFESAVEDGRKTLFSLDEDDFCWAIDIVQARKRGVRQLSLPNMKKIVSAVEAGKVATPMVQSSLGGEGGALTETRIAPMSKPCMVKFYDEKISVHAWKDVFEALIRKMNERDPSKFDALTEDAQFGRYFMRLEAGRRTPRDYFKLKLGTGLDVRAKAITGRAYLWRTDYYFRKLMDHLGIDAGRIEVI